MRAQIFILLILSICSYLGAYVIPGAFLARKWLCIDNRAKPSTLVAQAGTTMSSTPFVYNGPIGSFEQVTQGFELDQLGLNLMLGKSVVADGKGLFVSVVDDAEETFIPMGTVLCGYSKGSFAVEASSDKTVGYLFNDVNNLVIFNKEIMPLFDAITIVSEKAKNLTSVVLGHLLCSLDEMEDSHSLSILPDISCGGKNYFVPDVVEDGGIANVGLFANDLAYNPQVKDEEEYLLSSKSKNSLVLIWRMEFDDNVLRPTWPVVVFKEDTIFRNREPMEIGIQYSWSYWKAVRDKNLGPV